MIVLICIVNLLFLIVLFVRDSICSYYFTITNSWKFIVPISVRNH